MSLIDIIIDATWRGGSDTRRAQRDLGGVDKTAKDTGRSTQNLAKNLAAAGVAFGAVALAARKFWNTLEEGASLQLTEMRFNRLAESIGDTGEALTRDLRDATSGMLSDAQAMALATDLLALDLATTSDQTVRLARVVSELNIDMNELSLTIANQSRRRFDQMGVSLAGFDERLNALKGTMSDEEAFSMAFLQQAEAQIEKVGGASETAAGDLRRLNADWQQLEDDFKLWLLGGLAPALRVASGRGGEEVAAAGEGARESAESFEELIDVIARTDETIGTGFVAKLVGSLDDLHAVQLQNIEQAARSADSFEQWKDGMVEAFGSTESAWMSLRAALGEEERVRLRQFGVDDLEGFFEYRQAVEQAAGEAANFAAGQQMVQEALQETGLSASLTADEIAELASQAEGSFGGLADFDVSELERQLAELPTRIRLQVDAGELERQTERADLFAEFQADLTDITRQEEERREELETQHAERRSEIVDEYGRRRAEEEEDWLRRRARQEQRLRDDILETQQESAERRADLREEADDRLADLEQGHADRMQDIIENANHQLRGAASRLDAAAVARINEQRDRALSEEEERYADMRSEIMETLADRLEAEREAEQERIQELEENLAERQRIEEEDRRIRLRKMEEAHRRQLQELDDNHRDRLNELQQQAQQERNERERQYQLEHSQLVNFWDERQQTGQAWMRAILDQEEAWWEARATGGDFGDATTPAGGDDDDGALTTTGEAGVATRMWMERTALRVANPRNTEEANAWSRFFNTLSDQALADWIESNSDIDVPGYRHGLPRVPRDMLAMIHRDEAVLPAQEATMWRAAMGSQQAPSVGGFPSLGGAVGGGGITIEKGAINMPIHGAPGQSPQEIGREVERSLRRVFERLGS